jgi:hypothetical protein
MSWDRGLHHGFLHRDLLWFMRAPLLRAAFLHRRLILESLLKMKRPVPRCEGEVARSHGTSGLVGEVTFSVSLFSWDIFAR